jgi:ornithine cyclodeaminase/alanine dehydrogenase-like protein (mu-crystallin family)
MQERLGIVVRDVARPEDAVTDADIVVIATNTGRGGSVAYRGEWLQPGQHVVSIGSTATFLREIDEQALLRPDLVIFDAAPRQVASESGDVVAVLASQPTWAPTGTLDEVLAGSVGRSSPDQITLFKSVGTAAQDLIAAYLLFGAASARGVGIEVPDLTEPKEFA